MLVLGLSGGIDPVHENRFVADRTYLHDSAAVLVRDGVILAGIEQERLDRIKHSNKAPLMSARFCLDDCGVHLSELDSIAVYCNEEFFNASLGTFYLDRPAFRPLLDVRDIYRSLFEEEFNYVVEREKFRFIQHPLAHAMGAYALSGFSDCLILSIDGAGEEVSTMVMEARDGKLNTLASKPFADSLGLFYLETIRFLGYELYDEYKVMGLAPYGDPAKYRDLLAGFYKLLPNGDYAIERGRLLELYKVMKPRRKGEEFEQIHKDLAASLQEAIEKVVFHLLTHYRESTGHTRLAIGGGVAQNSTMNGKILSSGLFDDVFIPPSAADSECAFGAALAVSYEQNSHTPRPRIDSSYWGTSIGGNDAIFQVLNPWSGFVDIRPLDDTCSQTAALLADGAVIGWVQGRAEFGPRALGNRSILADPRPAENKTIINSMIKKREGYRPFAPSVLAEHVNEYFVLPPHVRDSPFMAFVLPVREEWRSQLGAITHIDGTARVQTVTRHVNPKYWELISAFGAITGIPMLLNTSFNNNCEPIVNTVEEALVCFLDSGLHYLVAGDYLVSKKTVHSRSYLTLAPYLPRTVSLIQENRQNGAQHRATEYWLTQNSDFRVKVKLSPVLYNVLQTADGIRCALDLAAERGSSLDENALADELLSLWSRRLIAFSPARRNVTA